MGARVHPLPAHGAGDIRGVSLQVRHEPVPHQAVELFGHATGQEDRPGEATLPRVPLPLEELREPTPLEGKRLLHPDGHLDHQRMPHASHLAGEHSEEIVGNAVKAGRTALVGASEAGLQLGQGRGSTTSCALGPVPGDPHGELLMETLRQLSWPQDNGQLLFREVLKPPCATGLVAGCNGAVGHEHGR